MTPEEGLSPDYALALRQFQTAAAQADRDQAALAQAEARHALRSTKLSRFASGLMVRHWQRRVTDSEVRTSLAEEFLTAERSILPQLHNNT